MLRWYWNLVNYFHERKMARDYWTKGPGKKPTKEEMVRLRELARTLR